MVALRTLLNCPNPSTAPTNCSCAGHNEPSIACNTTQKALWDGSWASAAADCIKVTPDMQDDWGKHDFHYPSNYANTCAQSGKEPGSYHCTWVSGNESSHEFAAGPNYNSNWNSEAWCTDTFCWVDPCTCDKTDIVKSTWLNEHYSYSACGSVDQYTAPMCTDTTVQTTCQATSGCKWVADAATPAPPTPAPAPTPPTPAPKSADASGANIVKLSATIVFMLLSFKS